MTKESKYQDLYNIGLDKEQFGNDSIDTILGELHIGYSSGLESYTRTKDHSELGKTGELSGYDVKRELEQYHSKQNPVTVEVELEGDYELISNELTRINTDYKLGISAKQIDLNSSKLENSLKLASAKGNDHDVFNVVRTFERLALEDSDLAKQVLLKHTLPKLYEQLNQDSIDSYFIDAKQLSTSYNSAVESNINLEEGQEAVDVSLIKSKQADYLRLGSKGEADARVSLLEHETQNNRTTRNWKLAGVGLAALVGGGLIVGNAMNNDTVVSVVEPVAVVCPVEQSDYNAVLAKSTELQTRLDEQDYGERLLSAVGSEAQIAVMDDYARRNGGVVRADSLSHFAKMFSSNTDGDVNVRGIKEILREIGMTDRSAGWEE